jgi:hypothetical protein
MFNATNSGKIRESLTGGIVNVIQVNPLPQRVIFKNLELSDLQLDPGESGQAFSETYPISIYVKTVQVQASYPVPNNSLFDRVFPKSWISRNTPKEWHHNSILDLSEKVPER